MNKITRPCIVCSASLTAEPGMEIVCPTCITAQTISSTVTQADLDQFCTDQAARHQAYMDAYGYTGDIHGTYSVASSVGPKFARIIAVENGKNSSVICFIDLATGNIHKAAGWKAPLTTGKTKGVRGNIFTEDRGDSCMSWCGTAYLR